MTDAQLDDSGWEAWLPPHPHSDAVRDFLRRGRASIVAQGPDEAPLLAFEDGGVMELPKVRYDEKRSFYHAEDPEKRPRAEFRATQYSDVCGSMDEIKRVVAEEPERAQDDPGYLPSLLEDTRYMIGRMYRRQEEYGAFLERLSELCQRLAAIPVVEREPAEAAAAELERMLSGSPALAAHQRERVEALAEQVRAVAQAQEDRLRDQKEVALLVGKAYRDCRGGRSWAEDEAAVEASDA
ncbi:MAG: hypothetical protein ACE5R4_13740 [Armatimonadota bacterium]